MNASIKSYKDLRVFQNAMSAAMKVFQLTETFPAAEKHSLTDQLRRSSRSVCSNITRAWRKRLYKTPFIARLNDSEGEACETQVWLEFARQCQYLDDDLCAELEQAYDQIMGQLVKMMSQSEKWLIKKPVEADS
jgi:four helix bundle protein